MSNATSLELNLFETLKNLYSQGTALKPQEIVEKLDTHIIGQNEAKRALAIALRNRHRASLLTPELQQEITPKNILMIGPTGVGKTELARRLAKLVNAPFIKVEATKFTEVGYVGRDVDSIIRDLVDIAFKQIREQGITLVQEKARNIAEEKILDILLPPIKQDLKQQDINSNMNSNELSAARKLFRKKLQIGELDNKEIEIELPVTAIGVEIMAPPGMEDMTSQLQNMFQQLGGEKRRKRKLKIKDAFKQLMEDEASKLINEEELKTLAVHAVQQNGIVFIDEFDKIAHRSGVVGGEVSREGVQRDLLPLIEGSTVNTKYGAVKTDHILFIASGAFHLSKPSDLIPELQGRLPIRVELSSLTVEDFIRILKEPKASLTEQYSALLKTEQVTLKFESSGIKRLAEIAFQINQNIENIGARRLHTVVERLLEKVSFDADKFKNKTVKIDEKYVNQQLAKLAQDQDLSQYIL